MTWPRSGTCESCGAKFKQYRPQHRFCKDGGCQKKRRKQRWDAWQQRQEEAGTYRNTVNKYQQTFRERTGYTRDWELRKKYGITIDQWLAMVEAAGGKCEICGSDQEGLCVDHDHSTGLVRGVLCRRCNRAIGQLGDTAERLRQALVYLER